MLKKILISVWVISLGTLIVASCNPQNNGNMTDAHRNTPVVSGTEYCGAAEKHLQEMCDADPQNNMYCCQAVQSTKKGKTFEQFCIETQNAGIQLDPRCLSQITKCEEIDFCLGTRQR